MVGNAPWADRVPSPRARGTGGVFGRRGAWRRETKQGCARSAGDEPESTRAITLIVLSMEEYKRTGIVKGEGVL